MFKPSIFGEILKLLPRDKISELVREHASDRWSKGFRSWDHLVAMLAGQLSGVTSLRDLEVLFDGKHRHHYHLHCCGVKRSTLSDANKARDYRVFADIAREMISRSGRKGRDVKKLLSVLDSSPIRLSGRGLDWALKNRTRSHNQGLKLHLALSPDDGGLDFASVTDMSVNDITEAGNMTLESGRIYLFDKGYCDYNWWSDIIEKGSHFVTRIKKNAAYKVLETCPLGADEADNVIRDQIIILTNKAPRAGKTNKLAGRKLRLVEIEHPGGKNRPFLIVSDILDASPTRIADLYKQRWSIELLFKWIKQNLKIKRFMGESRNAILIQIFTAIIAYTLVRLYKFRLGTAHKGRLKDLITTLKTGLFQPRQSTKRRRSNLCQTQQEIWGLL